MGRWFFDHWFLPVEGEFKSRLQTTAMAFGLLRGVGLDIRHRLPGLLVGLAASLRSMPTAVRENLKFPFAETNELNQVDLTTTSKANFM